MNRVDLKNSISDRWGIEGEHLFSKYPEFEVFRHAGNRKWFAVIMEIPENKLGLLSESRITIVNLKCETELIGSLCRESGIFPGWHMNKNHWITVLLNETVSDELIQFLLNMSYTLTN